MTQEQSLAFNSFLAANGLTKEDVRNQLNDEIIQHDLQKANEMVKRLEAEKAALEGRCFLCCTPLDYYYYKVISTEACFSNNVTCLRITEHPYFYKDDVYIKVYGYVNTVEVDVKTFQYYKEISAAEFEEAMITWAKDVLACEYNEEDEEQYKPMC